jgi:ABC-type glycerol-3-phosphate transport system substrate-binding protein
MDGTRSQSRPRSQITRREALRLGAGTLGAAMLGAAGCAPDADEAKGGGGGGGGTLVFLSTQLAPVEEAEKMRQKILTDYDGKVDFLGEDFGPFHDRIEAEARAGNGTVGVIGGEHGGMAGLAANDRLLDLSDLTQQLADRGFNEDFLSWPSSAATSRSTSPGCRRPTSWWLARRRLGSCPAGPTLPRG